MLKTGSEVIFGMCDPGLLTVVGLNIRDLCN